MKSEALEVDGDNGLYKGEDQSARAAKIQVAGEHKRVLKRSLKHLIPIEIRSEHAKQSVDSALGSGNAPGHNPHNDHLRVLDQRGFRKRPRRNAATSGELARRY